MALNDIAFPVTTAAPDPKLPPAPARGDAASGPSGDSPFLRRLENRTNRTPAVPPARSRPEAPRETARRDSDARAEDASEPRRRETERTPDAPRGESARSPASERTQPHGEQSAARPAERGGTHAESPQGDPAIARVEAADPGAQDVESGPSTVAIVPPSAVVSVPQTDDGHEVEAYIVQALPGTPPRGVSWSGLDAVAPPAEPSKDDASGLGLTDELKRLLEELIATAVSEAEEAALDETESENEEIPSDESVEEAAGVKDETSAPSAELPAGVRQEAALRVAEFLSTVADETPSEDLVAAEFAIPATDVSDPTLLNEADPELAVDLAAAKLAELTAEEIAVDAAKAAPEETSESISTESPGAVEGSSAADLPTGIVEPAPRFSELHATDVRMIPVTEATAEVAALPAAEDSFAEGASESEPLATFESPDGFNDARVKLSQPEPFRTAEAPASDVDATEVAPKSETAERPRSRLVSESRGPVSEKHETTVSAPVDVATAIDLTANVAGPPAPPSIERNAELVAVTASTEPIEAISSTDGGTMESRAPAQGRAEPQEITVPAGPATRGGSAEFADRLARAVDAARPPNADLQVRLNPPHFGSLNIEVTMRDGELSARLSVQTQEAQQLLYETLPQLRDSLAKLGAAVERIDVQLAPQRTEPSSQSDTPRGETGRESSGQQQDSHRRDGGGSERREDQTAWDSESAVDDEDGSRGPTTQGMGLDRIDLVM